MVLIYTLWWAKLHEGIQWELIILNNKTTQSMTQVKGLTRILS